MPPKKRVLSPLVAAPVAVSPKRSRRSVWPWLLALAVVAGGVWYCGNNYSVRRVATHEKQATATASTVKAPRKLQDVAAVAVDVTATRRSDALAELVTFGVVKDADGLNALNADGFTPLQVAVMRDDVKTAGLLVDAGADVDFINPHGTTALIMALPTREFGKGSREMVRFLLAAGADVNFHRFGILTPLACAAMWSDAATVRLLLDSGADAGFIDERGHDALYYARKENNAETVRVLESVPRGK